MPLPTGLPPGNTQNALALPSVVGIEDLGYVDASNVVALLMPLAQEAAQLYKVAIARAQLNDVRARAVEITAAAADLQRVGFSEVDQIINVAVDGCLVWLSERSGHLYAEVTERPAHFLLGEAFSHCAGCYLREASTNTGLIMPFAEVLHR